VFLRGGNWALNTGDAAPVQINTAINLIGAGSGNTFDAWGHINNATGADFCPTSGSSITCVYGTGPSYNFGSFPAGGGAGYIYWGVFSGLANCANSNISHIFFDGSLTTDGGDYLGLLVVSQCNGPMTVSDIRFLSFNNKFAGVNNAETQFFPRLSENITIKDSVFAAAASSITSGNYGPAQGFEMNGGSGVGQNILIQNNVFYENDFNPVYLSGSHFTANATYQYNDGLGDVGFDPGSAWSGGGMGGPHGVYCYEEAGSAQCNGNYTPISEQFVPIAPGTYSLTAAESTIQAHQVVSTIST
jgi:hypothetical protein